LTFQEWFAGHHATIGSLPDSIAEKRQSEIFIGRI
jgi:hypothetical protein